MASLRIQLRRDTAANWVLNNPILLPGELGIETDTLKFKVGNGSRWNATTSYALKVGEANGVATLNSAGKIPTSQLPDSISAGVDLNAAIAQLTSNSIAEGSTNKYFTNQRAIDAVSASIVSAIATETSNRNTAIAAAKTEAISTASNDATNKAATAKAEAIIAAAAASDTKDTIATAAAVVTANSYTDTKIATEVSGRNTAINTAISTEITNRNTAINAAVSGITAGTGTPGATGATGPAGPAGPAGAAGPQGLKGDTGESGPIGIGATGLQGPRGDVGPAGAAGAAGSQGLQGLKGDTGSAGANGTPGVAGTAATITVGSVTTGLAGSSVAITNSGTSQAAIFNFTIPRGDAGTPGSGGSTFTGTTDAVTEGTTNLYFTPERVISVTNQKFADVYVNVNQSQEDLLTYANNTFPTKTYVNSTFTTPTSLNNTLESYLTEADANSLYPKISIATGKIDSAVLNSDIARTSDIAAQIATVVNGAPTTFDTLKEISDYIASDQTAASSLTTLVGTKLSSSTAASTYAPLASPTFTGTVTIPTNTVKSSDLNWDVYDAEANLPSAATKHGMFAHVHGTGSAYYAHSGSWRKILDTTSAASIYATASNLDLKAPLASPVFTGTVDFSGATVTGITALPAQLNNSGKYLTTDGTSASWATLNLTSYATKASPAFTGTVDFSGATVTGLTTTIADSSITSAKILDGAIMNIDINASAAIDKTKIAGTAVTLSDTATVTNVMLANNYVGINGQIVSLGSTVTIPVGAKTFYNNTGIVPASGMVAGDIYVQY